MKKVNDKLNKFYKWDLNEFFMAIFGCLICAIAINIFIVPNKLYNGGILGISQLIRSVLDSYFGIAFKFDISGIINLLINLPLFLMAYKLISKTFFRRTVVCVVFQTIFLSVIPIPDSSLIDDMLTNVLIGGILGGIGLGITLTASGSTGGTDIIGLLFSMKKNSLSVGRIGRDINIVIYTISGILYGIPVMIYSIIYAAISSLVVDQLHKQNICSYAMIFSKKNPENLVKFIKDDLNRDSTYWEATGGFDNSKTYIVYSAMSKYEMQRLERHLNELSPHAFMIRGDGVGIDGNFKKKLTK